MVGTKAKGQRNELAIGRPLLLTEMANSEKKKESLSLVQCHKIVLPIDSLPFLEY